VRVPPDLFKPFLPPGHQIWAVLAALRQKLLSRAWRSDFRTFLPVYPGRRRTMSVEACFVPPFSGVFVEPWMRTHLPVFRHGTTTVLER